MIKFVSPAIACSLALPLFAGQSITELEVPGSTQSDAPSDTQFDISRFIDALALRAKHSYGMDLENSPAEFDFTELNLTAFITKPIRLGGDWSAIAYFDFSTSKIDFDGNPLIGTAANDIQSDLYSVALPVAFYHNSPGSRWTYGAWVNPSISSDFQNINSDDIFVDAAIGAGYQFNKQLVIGVGVYASDIFEDPFVIPGAGFVWSPNDDWLVSYYGPRFVARRDINHRNQIGLEVSTNGGSWNIDSNNNSLKLNLSSWRTGLFYRYNITGELWLQAAVGYTFANRLDLQTRDGVDLFPAQLGDAGGAPYALIGFSVARW